MNKPLTSFKHVYCRINGFILPLSPYRYLILYERLTKNEVSLKSICFSKLIYICNYISNLKHPVEASIVWSFLLMFG